MNWERRKRIISILLVVQFAFLLPIYILLIVMSPVFGVFDFYLFNLLILAGLVIALVEVTLWLPHRGEKL